MKRFISWMLIGIAALGLSLGAMAGVSDAGAYLGIAQTFAGSTDSYIGYTFGNVVQTSAFSVQFDVDDLFGTISPDGPGFLLYSTYGFGLLYEYDVDALNLELYANSVFSTDMTYFDVWNSGARAEFLVLPNPCKEVGPCYNPELKIFAEVGLTQDFDGKTKLVPVVIWGEVGFEVHL